MYIVYIICANIIAWRKNDSIFGGRGCPKKCSGAAYYAASAAPVSLCCCYVSYICIHYIIVECTIPINK